MAEAGRPRAWPAPAKLNLFLHVTGRRADGYHLLQTVFQLLDWGDEVGIEVTEAPAIVRTAGLADVPPEQDLAVRAARALQRAAGVRRGARLAVAKRIPAGAGLGGGSSDAATVLVALNRLWGCGLEVDALARLGLALGADVPVFVRGHSAWAEGIGERLEPLSLGERHYVVAWPDEAVSTAGVFADPALARDTAPVTRFDFETGAVRNDLEPVVLRRHPALRELRDALAEFGPAAMSGSGSAFFARVPDRAAAKRAATRLQCRYNVRAARGVDVSPLHRETGEPGVDG